MSYVYLDEIKCSSCGYEGLEKYDWENMKDFCPNCKKEVDPLKDWVKKQKPNG